MSQLAFTTPLCLPSKRSNATTSRIGPLCRAQQPFLHHFHSVSPTYPCMVADTQSGKSHSTSQTSECPFPRSIIDNPTAFWTDQWYPIAWTADVPPGTLRSFKLFDRPYVLFLDAATGIYVTMDDVCPHRAVPLSEGRLLQRGGNTVLECAYHGWQFSCSGQCTAIPAAGPDFKIPATTAIKNIYATSVVSNGLIFFFPGDRLVADNVPLPVPEILRDGGKATVYQGYWRALPIPYEILVENLIDPAHVPFAHHGTSQGNRSKSKHHEARYFVNTLLEEQGALVANRSVGTRVTPSVQTLTEGGKLIIYSSVTPKLTFTLNFYAVPTSREVTTVYSYRAIRGTLPLPFPRPFRSPWLAHIIRTKFPRWIDHCSLNLVLDGDSKILCDSERLLQLEGKSWRKGYVLSNGTWDVGMAAWRGWFERHGHTMPFLLPKTLAPELSLREVNDRVRWHGADCVSCTTALRRFRAGRLASLTILATALAVAVTVATVAVAMVACGYTDTARLLTVSVGIVLVTAVGAAGLAYGCQKGVVSLTNTDKAQRLFRVDDEDEQGVRASGTVPT